MAARAIGAQPAVRSARSLALGSPASSSEFLFRFCLSIAAQFESSAPVGILRTSALPCWSQQYRKLADRHDSSAASEARAYFAIVT